MELYQAEALATVEESQPDHTKTVLRDSGYGDLADQWLTATAEFENIARQVPEITLQGRDIGSNVVRAYAKRCVSWARISQLRDQALGRIQSLRQPT